MSDKNRSGLYAAIAIAGWATAATAFKIALDLSSLINVLFLASLTSVIIFFVIERPYRCKPARKQLFQSAFAGLLNPALYYIILFSAYSRLPAQVAQPLNYTWPLVLTLINTLMLKEKLHVREASGLIISFSGVALISLWKSPASAGLSLTGILLALGSSLFWALYWVLQKKRSRENNPGQTGLFWNFLWGTVFLLPLWINGGGWEQLNMQALASAVYVGCFEMGITFYFWQKALQQSPNTARLNQLIYLTPFISLIVITLVLHESLRLATLPGLMLIVTGILVGQKKIKSKGDKL